MYEQSLLCGIMNDWYGSMEDLFQDLKHYGFEVLESNRESITVSCDDDGDYVQVELVLGGTERTIVVEDFKEIYREETQKMKNVKIEWCENFIKSVFKKHVPFENGGIETGCFWSMAERSGLWERGTYGTPMSSALEKLTNVDIVSDDSGAYLYSVFRLKSAEA